MMASIQERQQQESAHPRDDAAEIQAEAEEAREGSSSQQQWSGPLPRRQEGRRFISEAGRRWSMFDGEGWAQLAAAAPPARAAGYDG